MFASYSWSRFALFGGKVMMTDLERISLVSASAFLNNAPGLNVACERSRTSLYSLLISASVFAAFTLAGVTGFAIAPSDLYIVEARFQTTSKLDGFCGSRKKLAFSR